MNPSTKDEDASSMAAGDLAPRLEREGLLILQTPPFRLTDEEGSLAARRWGEGGAKNISYHPPTGRLDVAGEEPAERERLRALMGRYAAWAQARVGEFFPAYLPRLEVGRTSLRFRSVEAPPRSWRKDDRRLHVDAFTSQPVRGRRILRVFSNIDASGAPRQWAVGEAFEAHARRFLPRTRRLFPGEAALLAALGLTKSRRSDYDQVMLGLHDAAKRDQAYQQAAPRRLIAFPGGATWITFTDQTPHAALKGQGALEQTFYLPVEALRDPASSPLRILERLEGSRLT
jgi:hypothetical protein